jgi:hypothetical protein
VVVLAVVVEGTRHTAASLVEAVEDTLCRRRAPAAAAADTAMAGKTVGREASLVSLPEGMAAAAAAVVAVQSGQPELNKLAGEARSGSQ